MMGPIGSGKSVACCLDMFRVACLQKPYGGVRRTRWAAIRNTYGELLTTTLKTYKEWFGNNSKVTDSARPIRAVLRTIPADGIKVEMEVYFVSLDRPDDVKKLKSLELTGCWLNEASELPKAVLDMAGGRVGRYPPKRWGGPTITTVILDTNPPDDDHWYYRLAEEEKPDGHQFFRQPPAILEQPDGSYAPNPLAENVEHQPLGYDYWLSQVPGKTRAWIKVYLQGQYGSVSDGRPVYPEYNDDIHVPHQPLEVMRGIPLLLGFDFGLTPACVVCQQSPRGQFRVIAEMVSRSMGIKQFSRDMVKPFLATHYPGMDHTGWGDPAGVAKAQTDERTCFDELAAAGFKIAPARSNAFLPRREAVAALLSKMVDGQPGFLLSPACKELRRGFNGAYQYRRMQVPGFEIFSDEPVKNDVSHPADALQYAAMGGTTVMDLRNVKQDVQQIQRARAASNWRTL